MIDFDKLEVKMAGKNGVYDFTSDSRNIFTPFDIAREIIYQMKMGSNNLVFNMEFVAILKDMGLIDTVWFATVCDKQATSMQYFGVDPSRIIRYKYNELDRFPTDMKFDAVIANPPYEDDKWVDFIELGYRITKKGGWVGFITPRWSMQLKAEKTRRLVFSMSEVKVIKHLLTAYFQKKSKDGSEWNRIQMVPQYFVAKLGNPTEKPVRLEREWEHLDEKFVVYWDVVDYDKAIPSFFGDKGLEVVNAMQSLPSADVFIEKKRTRKNVPAVHASYRHVSSNWGYDKGRTPNAQVFSTVRLDVDGIGGDKKGIVWYCKSREHAQNMYDWLLSDAMKLYMSQIDSGRDHVKKNFYRYPDCPITDRRATIEEMYKAAGMSDELIEWVGQMCAKPEK